MNPIPYFAYGSNLLTRRLQGRVPSAHPLGAARLKGSRLAWHKVGADGSGKCDIAEDPDSIVWGVLFEIDPAEMPSLDRVEGLGHGYETKFVSVTLAGTEVRAKTYQATRTDPDLRPWHWYKDLVLAGAVEHGLPFPYVQAIRDIKATSDPVSTRRSNGEARLKPE